MKKHDARYRYKRLVICCLGFILALSSQLPASAAIYVVPDSVDVDDNINDGLEQQMKTIKGVIKDMAGEPLPGASVVQKGTNNGVIADADGQFTLTVPANATLSIAYMGYATREIKLRKGGKTFLNILLREDSQQLREVVVTALGIKKDTKKLGYAVSTINADEIVKAGAPNLASAMYGKAPGIRITQTQGGSAGAVSINVRGLTSITGTTSPSSFWTVCPSATAVPARVRTLPNSATTDRYAPTDWWTSTPKILKASAC